jgi:hypothetical protein
MMPLHRHHLTVILTVFFRLVWTGQFGGNCVTVEPFASSAAVRTPMLLATN